MDTTARWPDTLARRLHVSGAARSVVNLGISGNRLLQRWNGPCLLARLDHDVLSIPAIRWIVFLIGINDLGAPGYLMRPEESVSAAEIQWGLEQIAVRAHDHGIRVMAGTLTPSGGTGMGYSGDEVETKRRVVNEWIRRASVFDAVIDFDAAVRDPADPTRIRSEFDSGDHLHPNAAGLAAMANTIDLRLL
jgi:lysophospholipase L1-like esterase